MKKSSKLIAILCIVCMLATCISVPALAGDSFTVDKGKTFNVPFPCQCQPGEGGSSPEIFWHVSTQTGNVSFIRADWRGPGQSTAKFNATYEGEDTLTLSCTGCGNTEYYRVYVQDSGSHYIGLNLDKTNLTMSVGDAEELTAYWEAGTRTNMVWSSSNNSVVRVSGNAGSATLRAVGSGRAEVTITDTISGESATCYVGVTENEDNWQVQITRAPRSANYAVNENPAALSCEAIVISPDGRADSRGITYQWYMGNTPYACNRAISGATNSYYYPNTSSSGTVYYTCVATYSVGSANSQEACAPVAVTVTGQEYGIYVTGESGSIYTGDKTNIIAYVYDANGKLAKGDYRINWSVSNNRVATLENTTTTARSAKTLNALYALPNNTANNVTVTASVTINGITYTDTTTVNIKADTYVVNVSASPTSLSSGQSSTLTATVYENGKLLTSLNPTVTWQLHNAGANGVLVSGNTALSRGTSVNTVKAQGTIPNMLNSYVTASVTINGQTYTGSCPVLLQKSNAAPVAHKQIVMQINNRNIVNGSSTFTNDVAPVIVNSRTMVPIRVITEALGGTASWADNTVILNIDGKTMNMTVGHVLPGFDVAPIIMNDRTYVPVRYVAQNLGAQVDWIEATQQIIINK